MVIQNNIVSLKVKDKVLERVGDELRTKSFKLLGHMIDEHLTWTDHIENVCSKISCGNYALARVNNFLPLKVRLTLYNSLIRPHLEYGILALGGARTSQLRKIAIAQKKAIRNVAGKLTSSHTDPLFLSLELLKFQDLFRCNCAISMYKYTYNILPPSFSGMFIPLAELNRTLGYRLSRSRNSFVDQLPAAFLPRIWNNLERRLKTADSINIFERHLLNVITSRYI